MIPERLVSSCTVLRWETLRKAECPQSRAVIGLKNFLVLQLWAQSPEVGIGLGEPDQRLMLFKMELVRVYSKSHA